MPKLSGALQYLLRFFGRNERNKYGGVSKWIYMVGNLRKRKVDCSKRPKGKKKKKKWSWTKAKEKIKRKKKLSVIWALLCKVSGCDVIGKEKLCYTNL